MAVGVDQAGEQGPARAVDQHGSARRLGGVAAVEQLPHLAVVADHNPLKCCSCAVGADL